MLEKGKNIPELPDEKRERFVREYKIKEYDANVITSSVEMARFFEDMIQEGASPKLSVSWLTVELIGRFKGDTTIENSPVDSKKLAKLVKRIEDSTISAKAAKDVLDFLMENDIEVDEAIDKLGVKQVSDDSAILAMIDEILSKNKDKVEEYKNGKEKLFGFFVGQVMKASKGSANPKIVNKLLKERLST